MQIAEDVEKKADEVLKNVKGELESQSFIDAFLDMKSNFDEDFLNFEENETVKLEPLEILKSKKQGVYLKTLLESNDLNFEKYIGICQEVFKTAYIPNPAGLRTETLELYSKLIKEHDNHGWVPIQMVGPGLVLAHFLPNYPKPEIPDFLAVYALIDEKAYWDYQTQVQMMEIESIRLQNNYDLITKGKYPEFYKTIDEISFIEVLKLLLGVTHNSSQEYQQVKDLYEVMIVEKDENEDENTIDISEDALDRDLLIHDGMSGLIGKINNQYDVWIKSKNSYRGSNIQEFLNVETEPLPIINAEEIVLHDDCKELLQDKRKDFNRMQVLPIFIMEDSIGLCSPKMDDIDVQNYLSDLLEPKKIYIYLCSERSYNNTENVLRQNIESEEAVDLFTQGMDIDETIEEIEDLDSGEYTDDDDRVINFVNQVMKNAIEMEASDIHFEVTGSQFIVRFRMDGKLVAMFKPFPPELAPFAIRRIKILAKMDTTKTRIPGDGGIKIKLGKSKRTIDMRIATCPVVSPGSDSIYEKCVIRILDDQVGPSRIDEVMWIAKQREILKRVSLAPFGIIIVTGPTGSGKSTTLYSVLNELNQADRNIVTAEDPVERKIAGVNQTPILAPNTFAKQLRSFLRMDPDVILVGEVRDPETADLAIKASQTGHLVLTTLHANTAIAAIPRLDSLGVKRQDIASSLLLLSAQRLGRKLCKSCRRKRQILKHELTIFRAKKINSELIKNGFLYEGRGCPMCQYRGYKGRMAIMEMLEVTNDIKEFIEIATNGSNDLKKYLIKTHGYENMYMNGLQAVARGELDFRELVSSIPDDTEGLFDSREALAPLDPEEDNDNMEHENI